MSLSRAGVVLCGCLASSLLAGCPSLALHSRPSDLKEIDVVAKLGVTVDAGLASSQLTLAFSNNESSREVCVPWAYLLSGWQDGFQVTGADGKSLPQRGPDESVDSSKFPVDFLIIPPRLTVSVHIPLESLLDGPDLSQGFSISWQGTAFTCSDLTSSRVTWNEMVRARTSYRFLQSKMVVPGLAPYN